MKLIKNKKRVVIIITLVLFICFNVAYFLPTLSGADWYMWFMYQDSQRRLKKLLCHTNHQALLEACMELSRGVVDKNIRPGWYRVRMDRHPSASKFPRAILRLDPTEVSIRGDGCVTLEMLGGLNHFGVKAYPKDYVKPPLAVEFEFGDKKLIDRLWYYDERYKVNPEFDKEIEALMLK